MCQENASLAPMDVPLKVPTFRPYGRLLRPWQGQRSRVDHPMRPGQRSVSAVSLSPGSRDRDGDAVGIGAHTAPSAMMNAVLPPSAVTVRTWFHAVHGERYCAQACAAPGPVGSTRSRASLWIGAVAQQVGYASPFALSTAFKRVRGVSPKEHRAAVTR